MIDGLIEAYNGYENPSTDITHVGGAGLGRLL